MERLDVFYHERSLFKSLSLWHLDIAKQQRGRESTPKQQQQQIKTCLHLATPAASHPSRRFTSYQQPCYRQQPPSYPSFYYYYY
mmetsp:Transcript_13781/g.29780  ORF Transcript_13781/g.29780 Transcript_13781/m.29780 type:complete len:84 (-) Transcript_13781:75-326(-)